MSIHVSKRPRYTFGGGTPAGGTAHAGHGFWSTAFTPGGNIPDFSEMPDPSTYANPLAQNFGRQPSTIWKDAGPLRQPDTLTEGTGQFLQPYPQGGQPPNSGNRLGGAPPARQETTPALMGSTPTTNLGTEVLGTRPSVSPQGLQGRMIDQVGELDGNVAEDVGLQGVPENPLVENPPSVRNSTSISNEQQMAAEKAYDEQIKKYKAELENPDRGGPLNYDDPVLHARSREVYKNSGATGTAGFRNYLRMWYAEIIEQQDNPAYAHAVQATVDRGFMERVNGRVQLTATSANELAEAGSPSAPPPPPPPPPGPKIQPNSGTTTGGNVGILSKMAGHVLDGVREVLGFGEEKPQTGLLAEIAAGKKLKPASERELKTLQPATNMQTILKEALAKKFPSQEVYNEDSYWDAQEIATASNSTRQSAESLNQTNSLALVVNTQPTDEKVPSPQEQLAQSASQLANLTVARATENPTPENLQQARESLVAASNVLAERKLTNSTVGKTAAETEQIQAETENIKLSGLNDIKKLTDIQLESMTSTKNGALAPAAKGMISKQINNLGATIFTKLTGKVAEVAGNYSLHFLLYFLQQSGLDTSLANLVLGVLNAPQRFADTVSATNNWGPIADKIREKTGNTRFGATVDNILGRITPESLVGMLGGAAGAVSGAAGAAAAGVASIAGRTRSQSLLTNS